MDAAGNSLFSGPRVYRKLLALLWPVLLLTGPEARAAGSPNIILIMSDDQGWGDFSLNGNKNLQTPNIDRLAQSGAVFSHFYVSPVCSPTRAELLTGRYHTRAGVYSTSQGGERLNLDETTFADIFKRAGYATAAFGKWHSGMQYPYHPNARGFDEFYGFCSGHWGDYFDPLLEHNGEIVQGKGFITDLLTDKALDYIDRHKDKPFFVYLPYNAPHSPMQVPDKWWDKFSNRELKMRADERYTEDPAFTKAALAMCENIDWNVGRIQDKIRELALEEETIIIYLNDNGPNSFRWNGGMKGRKGSTDEGGVRSPLIVSWAGKITAGLQIDEIAAVVDLFPSLADLAGITLRPAKRLDGISLKPLLFQTAESRDERIVFSHWNGRTSARTQKYRLDHEGGLFDMENDPGQLNDISSFEAEVTALLKTAVKNWEADALSVQAADNRPFPVGHPDFSYTQLPARDATEHGQIKRSNKFPNSSFFTNWTSTLDKITWDIEVLAEGTYEVRIYYSCPGDQLGSLVRLTFGNDRLSSRLSVANDVPLRGMEHDRVNRQESYVKDFKALTLGTIPLKKGKGQLFLDAPEIPGNCVMDFKELVLIRKP